MTSKPATIRCIVPGSVTRLTTSPTTAPTTMASVTSPTLSSTGDDSTSPIIWDSTPPYIRAIHAKLDALINRNTPSEHSRRLAAPPSPVDFDIDFSPLAPTPESLAVRIPSVGATLTPTRLFTEVAASVHLAASIPVATPVTVSATVTASVPVTSVRYPLVHLTHGSTRLNHHDVVRADLESLKLRSISVNNFASRLVERFVPDGIRRISNVRGVKGKLALDYFVMVKQDVMELYLTLSGLRSVKNLSETNRGGTGPFFKINLTKDRRM